jgi:glycosyltransferase involved in cell wall biosynthesis
MLPKERSIVTCHDLMLLRSVEGGTGFRGRRTSILRFRWSVSYMRQVAHVICVSDSTRDDVIRLVGVDPDRTSVVRLGIAGHFRRLPDADVQATRARLGLGGRIGVLNVSTGDPNKNVRGVLHVLHRLRRSGTDAVLLRVGRPLTGELRDLVEELDLSTAIVDSGRVDEDELVRVYNAADVLLHPSFYEGFGWPPLEAMACGTPVVSSSTPALLEVVGDVALTAEPTDHAALAACVLRAAEPTCAADLRTRGYAHAAKFTWHRTVAEVTGIYDRVLESVGA